MQTMVKYAKELYLKELPIDELTYLINLTLSEAELCCRQGNFDRAEKMKNHAHALQDENLRRQGERK